MTVFEHVMLGASLGLAGGFQRTHGWRFIGMAGIAGALPDWDSLSILWGQQAYADVHRVWGHNLLAAGAGGVLVAFAEYRYAFFSRLGRRLATLVPGLKMPAASRPLPQPAFSFRSLGLWVGMGVLAGFSHLAADFFYSGHKDMRPWPLPLLWPFSERSWAMPTVAWGDVGATLIFIGEMFALYRWPMRARPVAWLTLAAVLAYVGARWAALQNQA
jgi:membrane-bound metal-dependent hydrolase YbcI (DUF457 family)